MADRYVIYARKSSDEKDRQIKSIPDQLEHCRDLAKKSEVRVYKVFTEAASAKRSRNRPVFDELIELIEKGKVQGVISWHPDRLARNMLEAGMLMDLLDSGAIQDLKFCTFNFDNSSNGKLMLTIAFAMAKAYVDNLSDNVRRGVQTNLAQGKSAGAYKWGYVRNGDGRYEPDSDFFPKIKHAWEMRLEGKTYDEIMQWLDMVGCIRKAKTGNTFGICRGKLTKIFTDPIYYGVLKQNNEMVDLRKIEGYNFQPMVTYEEFERCQELGRAGIKLKKKRLLYPFREDIVRCECGEACVPEQGKSLLYLYCRRRKKCPIGAKRIRGKIIVDAITEAFEKNFDPTDESFDKYCKKHARVMQRQIDESYERMRTERKALRIQKGKLEEELNKLIKGKMRGLDDESELAFYEKEKARLKAEIKILDNDIKNIEGLDMKKKINCEKFLNLYKTVLPRWKSAEQEEKHQLAKKAFLNITVNADSVTNLQWNTEFVEAFPALVLDGGRWKT